MPPRVSYSSRALRRAWPCASPRCLFEVRPGQAHYLMHRIPPWFPSRCRASLQAKLPRYSTALLSIGRQPTLLRHLAGRPIVLHWAIRRRGRNFCKKYQRLSILHRRVDRVRLRLALRLRGLALFRVRRRARCWSLLSMAENNPTFGGIPILGLGNINPHIVALQMVDLDLIKTGEFGRRKIF